jgi:hypothetical protein
MSSVSFEVSFSHPAMQKTAGKRKSDDNIFRDRMVFRECK